MIYKMPYLMTKDTKIISFQFKITHRILACGKQLYIWKIDKTKNCPSCGEIDTIEHYLVDCKLVRHFWTTIITWLENATNVKFLIYTPEVIFGIPNEEKDMVLDHYNFVLLLAKYYVYKTKQAQKTVDAFMFLRECKHELTIKEEAALMMDKLDKFEQHWGTLYDKF